MARITRQMKREAALREVKMRRRVYPRWVEQRRISQEVADREIAVMEAIAADYAEPDLFAATLARAERAEALLVEAVEALRSIEQATPRTSLPWTHEKAADEYWSIIDRMQHVARATLAKLEARHD